MLAHKIYPSAPRNQSDFLRNQWKIVCDFDGTITPFDVTDAVLGRYALSEWAEVELDWQSGRITARECMRRQVELMRVSRQDLDAFLDTIPLTDGFHDFVGKCGHMGLTPQVVSDGMDYVVKRILSRHGLDFLPVTANRLVFREAGRYSLEFPHGHDDCGSGVCKCRVVRSGQVPRILLVGDGRSDCCLARRASVVLARKDQTLMRECQAKDLTYAAYDDFFDVCRLIDHYISSEQHLKAPPALAV